MSKKSDWIVCEIRLRSAPKTPEGIALSYIKNHPAYKSARELITQSMLAYWLPFGLANSGVEGHALTLACFEAIGELEKQINLIRRVLLEQKAAIPGAIDVPSRVSFSKTEVTIPSLDASDEEDGVFDSMTKTAATSPKKAADLF